MASKSTQNKSRRAEQSTRYTTEAAETRSLRDQRLDTWKRDPNQPFINQFICAQSNSRNPHHKTFGDRESEIAKTYALYDRAFGSQGGKA
ncbi:hypothetical protein ANO14919_089420 [Xylariales sp. No.14919]|nr:hypothetical protein ANO14919_089420 [Xylariales sp. No.14919]